MKYTQYKTTEIPWVGYLPSHWKSIRNGGLFDYRQNKVGDKFNEFQLLSLTTQGIRRKNINDTFGKVPASYEGYQEVIPGDMVFCLFDLDCSAVFSGVSDYHGMITSAYDVVRPREEVVNVGFLDYWFRAVFAGRYYKIFSKSVRYTINYDVFKAIKTPVPPREEQDQIVRYLDWKVSEINHLIHGYQKQIALLKERQIAELDRIVFNGTKTSAEKRESGIEYIGEVPSHWIVLQNHRIFRSMGRKFSGNETVLSLSQKDGLIPYSRLQERTLHTASYNNWQLVMPNDLVLNRFKAHLGVFFSSAYRGIVTFHYGVYEPRLPLISKYYETLYHTSVYRRVYAGKSKGMTVGLQNLSDTDFYTVYTMYPPIEEQKQIVATINGVEEKYSLAILKINQQIELLREYRTRLISDVVTGQIDVRDVVIPDYQMEIDNLDENADTEDMESEVNGDE